MPFQSRSQLRTCFSKNDPRWNCKEWLKETPSICRLPEKKGLSIRCRGCRKGEKVIGPIQTGPRGGRFFIIEEKDRKGKICEVKVYIK
jgi:hypothetical protein